MFRSFTLRSDKDNSACATSGVRTANSLYGSYDPKLSTLITNAKTAKIGVTFFRKVFFSMKNTFLKKVTPILAVFALVISVLNFGSYDPYNEFAVLTPEVAQAELSLSDLNVNDLNINSLGEAGTSNSSNWSYCTVTASADTGSVEYGSSVTLTWSTENAATITINGETQNSLSGSRTFHNIQANTTYTLRATTADGSATLTSFGTVGLSGTQSTGPLSTTTSYTLTATAQNGETVQCHSIVKVKPPVEEILPSCDAFTATPTVIQKGQSATLAWATTNATRVVIDNAIGEVAASGTLSVSPLATTTYTLTAFGTGDKKDTCTATITVKDTPVETLPKCEAFTATPTTLPVGGCTVSLAWSTKDANSVSISPTIGSVAATGTTSVNIGTTTTYTLTASNVDGNKDTCAVTIVVPPPTNDAITCADNVTISVADSVIRRGNSTTLTWSTTGITGVAFDNGITSTALSGSTTVTPSNTTTYTLTATDGTTSVACPVTVRVDGGGGGGSNAPRCELEISDTKIKLGESVVLTWDSTRATELFIEDQTEDRKIVTTEGLSSSKKDELFEGKITVKPKEDTRYLLTVKRGSSTRTCAVKVEIEDGVTFTQIRDQQPLVAGISLTEVPYTGFEAGPILTLLFYSLLMAWALYVAYLIVIRRDVFGGLTLATAKPTTTLSPEQIRSDVFVAKVQVPEMPVSTLPTNLPTGGAVVGYASAVAAETKVSTNVHNIDDAEMTAIENQAHAARVLLSRDAIRHFIATTNNVSERTDALNQVILAAKAQFPAEDGWIVLNEKRMQELCVVCAANAMHSSAAPYIPAVIPEGSGSLAEAIVGGNVLAAYELIGHRPMFALADAAADLDAVYRIRRGGNAVASELLMKSTASLTDAQVLAMIEALTGALDGTYNDEASAVKMSIMKAIKVVA